MIRLARLRGERRIGEIGRAIPFETHPRVGVVHHDVHPAVGVRFLNHREILHGAVGMERLGIRLDDAAIDRLDIVRAGDEVSVSAQLKLSRNEG